MRPTKKSRRGFGKLRSQVLYEDDDDGDDAQIVEQQTDKGTRRKPKDFRDQPPDDEEEDDHEVGEGDDDPFERSFPHGRPSSTRVKMIHRELTIAHQEHALRTRV